MFVASPTSNPLGTSNTTSCDFEQRSICGFSQVSSPTDDFNWSWDAKGTATAGTGPNVDHTLGTSLGNIGCVLLSFLSSLRGISVSNLPTVKDDINLVRFYAAQSLVF